MHLTWIGVVTPATELSCRTQGALFFHVKAELMGSDRRLRIMAPYSKVSARFVVIVYVL